MSFDARTALCVVDLQNDFADPDGSLFVTDGDKVVSVANEQIRLAREAGASVVYTQDWHPPDTPHFGKDGGVWPVHCVRETWGAAFHPKLLVDGPVIRKGTGGEDGYSGFTVADPLSGDRSPTRLEPILRERAIERIVLLGLATDYCVVSTALDAIEKGFGAAVLLEGVRAVDLEPGDGDRALGRMRDAGVELR